jgi:hypothetical protein
MLLGRCGLSPILLLFNEVLKQNNGCFHLCCEGAKRQYGSCKTGVVGTHCRGQLSGHMYITPLEPGIFSYEDGEVTTATQQRSSF